MTNDEAINAVQWSERLLHYEGPTALTKDDRRLWVKFAMEYSKEDFREGIEQYALHREKEWPPAFGVIRQYMPGAAKDDKKHIKTYPKGFDPADYKTYAEAQAAYFKLRELELKED